MRERNHPSADWYSRKIREMPDNDYLIGRTVFPAEEKVGASSAPTVAFGTLVRLERRDSKLTVVELAKKLDVEEVEIRSIEHDPAYRARPRTIKAISEHFKLPLKEIMKLAGVAVANDERFVEKAMRFAAHSDDMGALSKEEQQLLRSFVEFLRDNP